jgi:hypothetical protein
VTCREIPWLAKRMSHLQSTYACGTTHHACHSVYTICRTALLVSLLPPLRRLHQALEQLLYPPLPLLELLQPRLNAHLQLHLLFWLLPRRRLALPWHLPVLAQHRCLPVLPSPLPCHPRTCRWKILGPCCDRALPSFGEIPCPRLHPDRRLSAGTSHCVPFSAVGPDSDLDFDFDADPRTQTHFLAYPADSPRSQALTALSKSHAISPPRRG